MPDVPALVLYNDQRSNYTFAELEWAERRMLTESAVERLPFDAILIDVATDHEMLKTFALVKKCGTNDDGTYITYLVCHKGPSQARWLSNACYLENGSYGHTQRTGFESLIDRANQN